MKKHTVLILCLLTSLNLISYSSPNPQFDILVLHSYHSTFEWNMEINRGMQEGFEKQNFDVNIAFEYMDSKRIFDSIHFYNKLEVLKHKYKESFFDLIITTDDDALNFLHKFSEVLFPQTPLVFCGINNYQPRQSALSERYTGILENIDMEQTVRLAVRLFPEAKHLCFVGDPSTTSIDLSRLFQQNHQSKFPDHSFQYIHTPTIYELTDSLKKLPANSIILLWPYLQTESKQHISPAVTTRIISEAADLPVFGFWHFMLGHGIIGGKLVSGFQQGFHAANLAIMILEGAEPSSIEIIDATQHDYYFDYNQLKRFGIKRHKLPEKSIIINTPDSFFKKYSGILTGLLIAVIIYILFFLFSHLVVVRERRVLRKELQFQQLLINALPNAVFFIPENEKIQYFNSAFENLCGLSPDEINEIDIPPFYIVSEKETHLQYNKEVLLNQQPMVFEGHVINSRNQLREVIFYKSPAYNERIRKSGILETIVDITDKKTISKNLKTSEERYALVTKATRDGIWDYSPNSNELFVSDRLKEIFQIAIDGNYLHLENIRKKIHPEDATVFTHQLELLLQNVKELVTIELRLTTDAGHLWVEMKAFALTGKAGSVERIVGSVTEIQERKDFEISQRKWEEIFRNTRLGMATFDPVPGKPVLINPVFAKMHGYTMDELYQISIEEIVSDEVKLLIPELFALAEHNGHHILEMSHKRKNRSEFPVNMDITAVKNNRNQLQYFIVNIQDITERKNQENIISQMLHNEQAMNEELRSGEEELKQSLQQTISLKEKIEESQNQFLSFINGTSDFAFLKDKNLRYLIVNQSFAEFYKLSPDEITGKTDADITPKWLAEAEKDFDLQVLKEKQTIVYQRDVEGLIFETKKFPVFYGNNQIGIGAFIRDITRQKHIEKQVLENEQRFRTLLENSFDLISLTDINGNITFCTDSITRLTGLLPHEATGKNFMDLIHDEEKDSFSEKLIKIAQSESYNAEYIQHRHIHKLQGYKYIETVATNHLSNKLINSIVFTSRDVSMEHQTRELKKGIAIARNSAEIKQQFLANMSHEIRTPMNGIVGMIEFLAATQLNETQQDYVQTLKSSADSLLNIINDILDFSKIEAGKLTINPTPVHLRNFLQETPKVFAALLKQKNLAIETQITSSVPEYLNFDPFRLNQIISNLLSNAIKFTSSGSIWLRASHEPIDDDHVILRIEVEDTGIGIPLENQKDLFNAFTQVDSTLTRVSGGTGLGLTISQKLIDLMGGNIGVESQPDKGSTFWFTIKTGIPQFEKVKDSVQSTKMVDQKPLGLNILLVEDKVVNQKVIRLMLETMGCQITIANNGKEAVDLLHEMKTDITPENRKFDIILMDIQMPVMDGITATRIIRRDYTDNDIIIGLSANVFASDVEEYLRNGLNDYIIKPASSNDLYKKLKFWSEKSGMHPLKHEQETDNLISVLNREPVLEPQSIIVIQEKSVSDPYIINELFKSFEKDARLLAEKIEIAIKEPDNTSKTINDYLHTLYNLSLSMGGIQLSKTCEVLAKNLDNKNVDPIKIANYIHTSIENYVKVVRKTFRS